MSLLSRLWNSSSTKVTKKNKTRFSPSLESLEDRSLMAVADLHFSGNRLVVKTDNAATSVEVRAVGTNLQIVDLTAGKTYSYATSSVGSVEFLGGAGYDRFVDPVA